MDSQQGLVGIHTENATAKTVGIIVIGAVIGLVLLRRLSVSVSAN